MGYGDLLRLLGARASSARSLLTLAVVILAACFVDELTSPGVDAVQLTVQGDSVVAIGDATTLSAQVNGAPPSGGAIVIWSTNDAAVATVDTTSGVVSGITKDTVTITARLLAPELDSAITTTHRLRVAYASIAIDPVDSLTGLGETRALVVRGRNATGGPVAVIPNADVTFTVPNETVVALEAGGVVRAKANGTATVTAAYEGLNAPVSVRVRQVASAVTFPTDSLVFPALQFDTSVAPVVKDTRDSIIAAPVITWASGDPTAVSVTAGGVLRALRVAQDTVRATVDGVTGRLPTRVVQVLAGLQVAGGDAQADTVGLPIAVPPSVKAVDRGSAGIQGVNVTFLTAAGNGTVGGAGATTDAAGVAAVGSWTLDTIAGQDTLVATAGSFTARVVATGVAGTPTQIARYAGDSQTTVVSTPVPTPPAVILRDQYGNPTPNVAVTFAISGGGGSVSTSTVATGTNGVAAVTWTLGPVAGDYNNVLSATALGGSLSVTFTASASARPAAQIAATSPIMQTTTVGSAVTSRPSVTVRDDLNNPVEGVRVVFAVTRGGGLLTGDTAFTNSSGVATVGSWTLGTVPDTNRVEATFESFVGSPAVFTAIGVAGALPLQIAKFSVDSQTASVATAVGTAPAARVTDAYGNVMAGHSVTFAVLSGGGTVSGPGQVTNASGVATVGGWTLGTTAGTNTLRAQIGSGASVTFTATGTPGAATQILTNAGNNQTGTVNQLVAVAPAAKVADQYGNGVSGVSVTFAVGTGAGAIAGASQTTNASGVATVGSWRLGTAAGSNNNTLVATAPGIVGNATFTASATAGAAVSVAIESGNGQTAEVGTAVATAPGVVVRDSFSNPVSGVAVTYAVGLGGGSVTGAAATSNASGIARVGSWTLGSAAGTNNNTLTATATGLQGSPLTFTASATAGAAQNIAIQAGNGQTATAGTAVATAPAVLVTDRFTNPKAGVNVTFAATAGNGTITGPATVTSDANGIATVGGWTLHTTAGSDTLTATSSGLTGSPLTFTATGTAGAATQISVDGGQGQTADAGTTLPTAYTVKVADANGNGVSGVLVTWTVTGGGGSITPGTSTTSAQGIATASRTLGPGTGAQTVEATVGAFALSGEPVVFTATANAGAAATIEANSLTSQSDTVGDSTAAAPSVLITDQYGNPKSGVSVTFAVTAGGGQILGGTVKTTDVNGVASVNAWVLGTTAGTNTVTATSAGLTGSPVTFTAMGVAGAAVSLELSAGDGQTAAVNSAVPIKPAVRVVDGFGNPKSGISITFAVSSGGGSVTSATQTTNASGIATVGNWTLGTAAGTNTLEATTTSGSITLANEPVVFSATGTAGTATQITSNSSISQTATVGSAVAAPPSVLARDQFNNAVSGVSVTFTLTAGGGSLVGGSPQAVTTNASGVATAGAWTLGTVAGTSNNTVTAAATGLSGSPVTFSASGAGGAPDTLIIVAGNNQSAVASTNVPTPPSVRVTDQYGNVVSGTSVTFTLGSGGGQINGGTAPVGTSSDAGGVASLVSWTLGSGVGVNNNSVVASGTGLTSQTFLASGNAAADLLAKTATGDGDGQTATVGNTLPNPYRVIVTNAGSPVQNVTVAWTVTSGGGSLSSATSLTDVNGIATVVHTLGPTEGAQSVQASVGGLSGSPQTFTSTGTGTPPAALAIEAGNNQTAVAGSAVATAPSVRVTDAFGNPKSGITVTFSAAAGNGTITGGTQVTNASGVATVGSWTLSATAGADTLSATTGLGLTGEPVLITATGVAGAATAIVLNSGDAQTGVAGQPLAAPFTVRVTDANGNGVSGVSVTWTVTAGGGSIPSTSVTNASGVASATLTLGVALGTNSVNASAGALGSVVFNATGTAGGPSDILLNAGDGQTATVATAVATAPSVVVEDAIGNAVNGATVIFEIVAGDGVLNGTLTTFTTSTNSSGIATVASWTLGTGAGTQTVVATAPALPGDSVFINATATAGAATQMVLNSGDGQTGTVGAALAAPYSVQVADQYGNGVAGVTVNWSVTSGGGSITASSITSAQGLAVATRVLGSTQGIQTADAASGTLAGSPVSFSATAQAGAPAVMAVWVGNGQSATVGTAVATPPTVVVADQFANPTPDVPVTFTITAGGGSLNPGASPATVLTDANGLAALGSWTLGTTAGANAIEVTSAGLSPVTFTATGTAGAPVEMELVEGDAQAATVNTAVSIAPAVRVLDQYGNGVPSLGVTFTPVAGGGAVIGGSTTTDGTGVARVGGWTLGTAAGPNQLQASAPGYVLTGQPVSFSATGTPAGAASIAIYQGDAQLATVGTPVATEPQVLVTDQFGNPVLGAPVQFALVDGGSGVGTLTRLADTTDASGVAGVGTWTLSTTAGANYLQAAINGGAQTTLLGATGLAGTAVELVPLGTDGQIETVGNYVPQPLVVQARDQYGNPVPGVPVTVRTGQGNGLVFGSDTSYTIPTDAFGLAVSWQLDYAAGPDTITFIAAGLAGSPIRYTATANPGAPALQLLHEGDGQGAQVNTPVPVPPKVRVTDGYGNGVPGVPVQWFIGCCLGGTTDSASSTTDAFGIASPGNWTLGFIPGDYYLSASTGFGLVGDPTLFRATAVSASADSIEIFSGDGQGGVATTTLPGYLEVRVVDIFKNGVQGVPVSWSISSGNGSVTVIDATTDFSGIARAQYQLGKTAGVQTVEAGVGGLKGSPATFTATGTPDAAYEVVIAAGDGQSAQVNTALPTNPVFQVRDQYGNGVPSWYVEFAATGGSVSTVSLCTDVNGYAEVGWTLPTVAGAQQLYAYTGADPYDGGIGCAGGAGVPFLVNSPLPLGATGVPGPVNAVQVSPASATFGAIGSTRQFSATARDQYGNVIPGAGFAWSLPLGTAVSVNAASGLVTSVANGSATVRATSSGVSGDAAVTVAQVTRTVRLSPSGASVTGASATQPFTAEARDSNNYVIAGKTFAWASLNPAVATIPAGPTTGATATAAAAGQVTISALADGVSGYGLLTVAAGGSLPVGTWNTQTSPTANTIYRMWGRSASEAYAVGAAGAILRWNGSAWSAMTSPTTNELRGVWGSSSSNIFAVGFGGTILRYNGSTWSAMSSPTTQNLYSVWGTGPNDVFAVGASKTILHYDGSSWSVQAPPPTGSGNLYTVWGAAPNDVYAVGSFGMIVHYDGSTWSSVASPTGTTLIGIWGTSSTSIYAVGVSGVIVRYTGVWSTMTSPATVNLNDVWGTTPNEVYAAGLASGGSGTIVRYTGTGWTTMATGTSASLYAVWGTNAGDVYVGGASGTIRQGRRGVATVTVTPGSATAGAFTSTKQFTATARDADGNVLSRTFTWSSSNGAVASVGSSTGLATAQGNGTASIIATPTLETWVSGSAAYTVSQVTNSVTMSTAAVTFTSLASSTTITATARDSNAFAISGKVITYSTLNANVATINSSGLATPVASGQAVVSGSVDGKVGYSNVVVAVSGAAVTSWAAQTSPTANFIRGMWGTNASNVFAVAATATILRFNGTSWSTMSNASSGLYAVWGSSGSDVFAVGSGGEIHRYNGVTWSAMTSPTGSTLYGVFGFAPNNVYAVGASGTIVHYNGTSWSTMTSGTTATLYAVWGWHNGAIWAVGSSGTILRYDGSTWSTQTSGTAATLLGVWGTTSANVYAVGSGGTILRWNGSTWAALTSGTTASLRGIWGSGNADIYATGSSGAIVRYNGSTWAVQTSGTTSTLEAVWGTQTGNVWTGGSSGVIRRGTR